MWTVSARTTPGTARSTEKMSPMDRSRSNGQPRPSGPPTTGLMKRYSADSASVRTFSARTVGAACTSAVTVMPWYDGTSMRTRVVSSRRSSRNALMLFCRLSGSARSCSTSDSGGTSTRGTTSSRTGSPTSLGGRHRARATPGAASMVSRSKSCAVTARWPPRRYSGPRTRAFSTDSASTPPLAGSRLRTDSTDLSPVDGLGFPIGLPAGRDHQYRLVRFTRQDRRPADHEGLARPAGAGAEQLGGRGFGVVSADHATETDRHDCVEHRRLVVRGLPLDRLGQLAAQPVRAVAADRHRLMTAGQQHAHLAGSVEPVAGVGEDPRLTPVHAVPALPHAGRTTRVDARALDPAHRDVEPDHVARQAFGEAQGELVARLQGGKARNLRAVDPQLVGVVLEPSGAAGQAGADHRLGHDEVLVGHQDEQLDERHARV